MFTNITKRDLKRVCDLYGQCFEEDHFFLEKGGIPVGYCKDIAAVIDEGMSSAYWANGQLRAGLLLFDTSLKHRNPEVFNSIFGIHPELGVYPYKEEILDRIPEDAIYILAGFVEPVYRRNQIYTRLLKSAVNMFGERDIVSDISNLGPMTLYKSLGFSVSPIADDYYFIHRPPSR